MVRIIYKATFAKNAKKWPEGDAGNARVETVMEIARGALCILVAMLILAYVPFGVSIVVTIMTAAFVYKFKEKLPAERIPFAGCILAAALLPVSATVLYCAIIGYESTRSGFHEVMGVTDANFISGFVLVASCTILAAAYMELLNGCVKKVKAELPAAGEAVSSP